MLQGKLGLPKVCNKGIADPVLQSGQQSVSVKQTSCVRIHLTGLTGFPACQLSS